MVIVLVMVMGMMMWMMMMRRMGMMMMMVVVMVMISVLQCSNKFHGFFPLGNFSALALTRFSCSSPLLHARHF